MLYKKTDDLMDLATFMQASSEGVSIQDIWINLMYQDEPLFV